MIPSSIFDDYLSDQSNGIQGLITRLLNQVLQLEALQKAGADHHERTAIRTAYCNGPRDRSLITQYGDLILTKPQCREKPFETQVFGRYAVSRRSW